MTTTTTNAITSPACPPWCSITDHEDWDGGTEVHRLAWATELANCPYVVRDERHHEHANVVLEQDPDDDEAVIQIEIPAAPGSTHRKVNIRLSEAEDIAFSITSLVAMARGQQPAPSAAELAGPAVHAHCYPLSEYHRDLRQLVRVLGETVHTLSEHGLLGE